MIAYKDIEQGSEDWFLIKWGKVGGSTAKGLYINSDTLFLDLLSQHLEEFELEESFDSFAMMRGRELEPFARDFISDYTGIKFEEYGWLQSKKCSLLGISPDGMSADEKVACEIKCLGRKAHAEVLINQEPPRIYMEQIIHYFTINPKLESLFFIAFRPETVQHFIKEYKRTDKIDLGWKKKVEVPQFGVKGQPIKPKVISEPDIKTVSEWSAIAIDEALRLEKKIKETVELLQF